MKDIAAQAGVSVMTVSYALRGHPRVSKKTTEKIRAIAVETGYQPHPLVAALTREIRAGRKVLAPPVIAYVTSYARRDYSIHGGYFGGTRTRCEELGFAFAHYELTRYGMSGKRLSEAMKYNNVCGVAIGPVPPPGESIDLDWDAFPCVAFGYTMQAPALHRVAINHWKAIRMVLRKLTEMGYRRIANGTTPHVTRWIGGIFEAGVDAYHREIPPSRRLPILTNVPRSPEAMNDWLRKHRPDVFVSHLSRVYEPLIKKAGWRIPDDLACVTLGWSRNDKTMAGLDQHPFRVGKVAVDVLVQQIYDNRRGIPEFANDTLVDGRWVDGPSAPGRSKGRIGRKIQ